MADKRKRLARRIQSAHGYSYQAALNLIRSEEERQGREAAWRDLEAGVEEALRPPTGEELASKHGFAELSESERLANIEDVNA